MNCKPGDMALMFRNCVPEAPCRGLLVGRAIVRVTRPIFTNLYGWVWQYEGPLLPCPKNPSGCRIPGLLDDELKPLPPEEEVRQYDAEMAKPVLPEPAVEHNQP